MLPIKLKHNYIRELTQKVTRINMRKNTNKKIQIQKIKIRKFMYIC